MRRSVPAFGAGLLTFLLITWAGGWVAGAALGVRSSDMLPGHLLSTFAITTLVLGALAGIASGYVAAAVGRTAPLAHALGVAVVLAALSLYVLPRPTDSSQPRWLPYALTVVGAAAMLAGGALRARLPARSRVV